MIPLPCPSAILSIRESNHGRSSVRWDYNGRQTSACSDKCRAAKSRRARIPIPAQDLRRLRDGLVAMLDSLWEAKATLEKYL